jgi:UDP-N-acetylglucosamine 2-epimerase (non-hydrolysing)
MNQVFFRELDIPEPHLHLNVGSGSHGAQTARILERYEAELLARRPSATVVFGDVNSTVACALAAAKLGVPVAHVEAGLRSFDRTMPEEINRVLTDSISQWLFVSERAGVANLRKEGIPDEKIFFVGNVMIDTLLATRSRFEQSAVLRDLGISERAYAVVTLHRPSNVDDPKVLAGLLGVLKELQREIPLVFPIHPRTRKALNGRYADGMPNLRLVEPMGYFDFMKLVGSAQLVLTDSGGIQEESTVLGVPCLTLRKNTERPATVDEGTNILIGQDPARILSAARSVLASPPPAAGRVPELWDGRAAGRILDVLTR